MFIDNHSENCRFVLKVLEIDNYIDCHKFRFRFGDGKVNISTLVLGVKFN